MNTISTTGREAKVRRWVRDNERLGYRLVGALQPSTRGISQYLTATMEWPTEMAVLPEPTSPVYRPIGPVAPCCGRVPLSAIGYNPANGRIECAGCGKLWVPEGYATNRS